MQVTSLNIYSITYTIYNMLNIYNIYSNISHSSWHQDGKKICFLSHQFLLFEQRKLFFHITHHVGGRSVFADGLFKQKLSAYGNRVPPHSLSCTFMDLSSTAVSHSTSHSQRHLQPTRSWHAVCGLSAVQLDVTGECYKQSYRRVLHNEVTSSHRPAALSAAAQTTDTKNKWHKSCTSLQNNSGWELSPLLCVR